MRIWLALFAVAAMAQDAFLDRWRALRAMETAELRLAVSTSKQEYYLGEAIPLTIRYSAVGNTPITVDGRLQDRIGRLNGVEQFVADPAGDTEDPLAGTIFEQGGLGGLSGGPIPLARQPFEFARTLNDWVRFRKPGTFRVYVIGRRVTGMTAVSNVLTFTIVPAPAAWVDSQIRQGDPDTLRYLDTPEAALALARQLDDGDNVAAFQAHLGVLGSRSRPLLLPYLEGRLTAPDQPVWPRYLDTLQRLEELVHPGRKTGYIERLRAAVNRKQGAARAICLKTLVELGRPVSPAALAGNLRALPEREQVALLETNWGVLRNPAMLPVLRELYALPRGPLPSIALRRLYALAPEEGRALILSQLQKPDKNLAWEALALLPDDSLPALDEALAARLEAGSLDDRLIVRYATGAILNRVKQVYRARPPGPGCSLLLPFYFLKHDPRFGEAELRRTMQLPACMDMAHDVNSVGRSAMSPALEQIAISMLASPYVPVKRGAAETLGRYGSAAVQEPLWETLAYFRAWWKGKEPQIGQDGLAFERTLRLALVQSNAWVLDVDALRKIQALCSSAWCRQETGEWIAEAAGPVRISLLPGGGEDFMVAQTLCEGYVALERRLHMYPRGTTFQMDAAIREEGRATTVQIVQRVGHRVQP
ncbi:MAG TPA: hypothetical protein VFQ91_09800 [Bryobacteraceae bacterium]|nr:hypothetical protein [Bryobacteraceae bacterium]